MRGGPHFNVVSSAARLLCEGAAGLMKTVLPHPLVHETHWLVSTTLREAGEFLHGLWGRGTAVNASRFGDFPMRGGIHVSWEEIPPGPREYIQRHGWKIGDMLNPSVQFYLRSQYGWPQAIGPIMIVANDHPGRNTAAMPMSAGTAVPMGGSGVMGDMGGHPVSGASGMRAGPTGFQGKVASLNIPFLRGR